MKSGSKRKLIVILLALFFIELVFQVVSTTRYLIAKYNFAVKQQRLISDNWFLSEKRGYFHDIKEIFYSGYHPLLGWIARPMSLKDVHITEEGTRITSGNPADSKREMKNIFFFGGSTMFGLGSADQETIPSVVARKLNTTGEQFRVTNYGQMAFNSNQELILLIQLLKSEIIPDLVIFYDGCNDLFSNLSEVEQTVFNEKKIRDNMGNMMRLFDPSMPENKSLLNTQLLSQLLEGSSKYVKLFYYPQRLLEKFTQPKLETGFMQSKLMEPRIPSPQRIADNYKKNTKVIDALSRSYGFKYLLVWQPLVYEKPSLTAEEKKVVQYNAYHPDQLYASVTQKLLSERINNFYDLTSIFDEEKNSIFFDECHISPKANEAVAYKLAELIGKYFP
jgi:lysophospholipase L1-like esterase